MLFDNWLLAENGRFREAETRRLLTEAPYPSRNPDTNLADLRAQIAANHKGVDEVAQDDRPLRARRRPGLHAARPGQRRGSRSAASSTALDDGAYRYETDSGAVIAVRVTVDRASARRRSTSPAPRRSWTRNFNAPSSVATAAVLYVFRTLVADDIPLNDGCLRPLHIVIPEGSMLAPIYPAAVVAGNVETSQAITGALYAALRRPGRGLRHDEQRHLRQRAAPVLRDRRLRLRGRRRVRRARPSCRPT